MHQSLLQAFEIGNWTPQILKPAWQTCPMLVAAASFAPMHPFIYSHKGDCVGQLAHRDCVLSRDLVSA